jgi:hypothetical protein
VDFNSSYGNDTCVLTPDGKNAFNYTLRFGVADVLFVVDNSGSMSFEHSQIANRFMNFINSLFSQNIDYRIGLVTTDVSATPGAGSPRSANGFGAFQDGKLLRLRSSTGDSGKWVIDKSFPVGLADDLFRNTVRRQETITCETSNFDPAKCPTDNERGIYAVNMALDRNEDGGTDNNGQPMGPFFRPGGHLAVVVLSDEDERSGPESPFYNQQEEYDLPTTLVRRFGQKFPLKTISVHSIIVRPGDTVCEQQQENQFPPWVSASPGRKYAQLTELNWPSDGVPLVPASPLDSRGPAVEGYLGSICASDYLPLVNQIATRLTTPPINLACANPSDFQFQISGGGSFSPILNGSQLTFNPPLPPGRTLQLSYKCDR